MTKEYLIRQFSNFYNEVVKGKFAKREDVENLNVNDISISSEPAVIYDINHLSSLNANSNLENGVLTYICPSKQNTQAGQQEVKDEDIKDGVFKILINVTECIGTYVVFFNYPKKTGGWSQKDLLAITQNGTYEVAVDLNYYAVYMDANITNTSISINNGSTNVEGSTTNRIVIDRFDILSGGNANLHEYNGKKLGQAIGDINAKVNSMAISLSNTLVSPNGNKFIPQVDNNGAIHYAPILPNNILYIGNSLLLGFGNRGMASVEIDGDYYAKVNHYLEEQGKTLTTDRVLGVNFEKAVTDSEVDTFMDSIANLMSTDRQLVIIQLGDNVGSNEQLAEFEKSCNILCSYVRENCTNARVAWVGTWWDNATKNTIIQNACQKYGVVYIDISGLSSIPGYKSAIGTTYIDKNGVEQTITDTAIARHPSDAGFTAIANRIITTLFE